MIEQCKILMKKLLLELHGIKLFLVLFLKFFQVFSPSSYKCVVFSALRQCIADFWSAPSMNVVGVPLFSNFIPLQSKLKILGIDILS